MQLQTNWRFFELEAEEFEAVGVRSVVLDVRNALDVLLVLAVFAFAVKELDVLLEVQVGVARDRDLHL